MAIQFYLTNVGRTAALNATLVGLDLQIKHIAVGSGQYNAATAAPTKTALTTELERYLVNGGEIEPTTHTLRFTVNLNSTITADIYEIGLFDENNVLFAVASSTTTPLVRLINEVITIITFGFSLDDVDSITLMLDVNSPLAVTLMNQHTAHEHPHAQYKRINDDTERLKVANGTDLKDAVNKSQLDAEETARSNADTNLQNTKAALNGDNTQRFKASMALYLDEVVNKAQLDSALSATLGSLNLSNKADKNGNSGEFFNVKNAVDSSHAVNKGQLDTEATARANADTALQNSKAELAGSSTQQFSVADGSTQYHAVNKGQLDALAGASILPTGSVIAFCGFAAPIGWLECNGQSTTGYPALTAVVGLNVPDLRGEFIRGWSHGRSGVDEARALLSFQEATAIGAIDSYGVTTTFSNDDGTYAGANATSVNGSTGSDASQVMHKVRPRNVALMYIIKT